MGDPWDDAGSPWDAPSGSRPCSLWLFPLGCSPARPNPGNCETGTEPVQLWPPDTDCPRSSPVQRAAICSGKGFGYPQAGSEAPSHLSCKEKQQKKFLGAEFCKQSPPCPSRTSLKIPLSSLRVSAALTPNPSPPSPGWLGLDTGSGGTETPAGRAWGSQKFRKPWELR